MGNLYLVDQPAGASAFALAAGDGEAIVVLIQDGVYLDASALTKAGRTVCAVQRDLERRGLAGGAAQGVKAIGFDELVDLIVANKVVNFA